MLAGMYLIAPAVMLALTGFSPAFVALHPSDTVDDLG
jgi:hypothetical protein